jgi:dUTPase
VVQSVSRAQFAPVAQLPDSSRGIGGYGSTGAG